MRHRVVLWIVLGLAAFVSACGREQPTAPPPIYVTATPFITIAPVVATETPTITPVLASTDTSMLPTRETDWTSTPRPVQITMTPTFTPTHTDTPVTPGGMAGYGPVGGGNSSSGSCATAVQGVFAAIYQSDPAVASGLGCPLAAAASSVTTAYEPFQNGMMIWASSLGAQPQSVIYVLFNNHTYQRFNNTFQEGVDPESSGAVPPDGLIEPVRGFGKVWRDNTSTRDNLGWATSGESAGSAQIQVFERGEILTLSQTGQTYILMTGAPGTWSTR